MSPLFTEQVPGPQSAPPTPGDTSGCLCPCPSTDFYIRAGGGAGAPQFPLSLLITSQRDGAGRGLSPHSVGCVEAGVGWPRWSSERGNGSIGPTVGRGPSPQTLLGTRAFPAPPAAVGPETLVCPTEEERRRGVGPGPAQSPPSLPLILSCPALHGGQGSD